MAVRETTAYFPGQCHTYLPPLTVNGRNYYLPNILGVADYWLVESSLRIHISDADPDPDFHLDADPDPTFHSDADPYPTFFQFDIRSRILPFTMFRGFPKC